MSVIGLDDFQHGIRVASKCRFMGAAVNLERDNLDNLYLAGLFHDIGKAHLDQTILNKKELLTPAERLHINTHALLGRNEMKRLMFQAEITDIILCHHENYDGSGYPGGLVGKEIPYGARLLRLVDVFDALTSDRPYRKRLSLSEALRIMENEKTNYDPLLYHVFCSIATDLFSLHSPTLPVVQTSRR